MNDIQLPVRLFVAVFRAKLTRRVDERRDEHAGELVSSPLWGRDGARHW